jgi:hypothetical protein
MSMAEPKIGEDIYIDTELYLSHGRDDFRGGLAKVVEVKTELSAGKPCLWVRVEEQPDSWHNWTTFLGPKQDKLRAEFGQQRAHPEPDLRPQFNEW